MRITYFEKEILIDHVKHVVWFLYPKFRKCEKSTIIKEPPSALRSVASSLRAFFYSPIIIFFLRAPHFEMLKQTLLLQLTQPRHPHGTQKVPLSAAAFLP